MGSRTRNSVLHKIRWRFCRSDIQMEMEDRLWDTSLDFADQTLARDVNLGLLRGFKFKKLHEITK